VRTSPSDSLTGLGSAGSAAAATLGTLWVAGRWGIFFCVYQMFRQYTCLIMLVAPVWVHFVMFQNLIIHVYYCIIIMIITIYIYVRYAVYERFKPVMKPRPRCILLSLDDSHLQYCDLVPRSPVGWHSNLGSVVGRRDPGHLERRWKGVVGGGNGNGNGKSTIYR